jgi:hypothetical protein
MRPRLATVISPAPWERDLVAAARLGGMARVVGRGRTAADVETMLPGLDVLVVGGETPWLTPGMAADWSERVAVIGMWADPPARDMLAACQAAFGHDAAPARILAAAVSLSAEQPAARQPPAGQVVTVVGPRGCPGVSESALAITWAAASHGSAALVELDIEAPCVGLRLGLAPGAALDHTDPGLGGSAYIRRVGPIHVLPAPIGLASKALASRVVGEARRRFDTVVLDAGPIQPAAMGFDPGRVVLVVDGSPAGVVRAARMVRAWDGPAPAVVANRIPDGPAGEQALRHIRAATGREPAVVVPVFGSRPDGVSPHPLMLERFGWQLQTTAAR